MDAGSAGGEERGGDDIWETHLLGAGCCGVIEGIIVLSVAWRLVVVVMANICLR